MADQPPPYALLDGISNAFGRSYLTLLSEGSLIQLILCFFLSPARVDPFLIGPLLCLYALREDDRRALELYGVLGVLSVALDLIFLFSSSSPPLPKLFIFGALALKVLILFLAVKVHDNLPSTRPCRAEPAQLQAKVQEVVESVLRELLTDDRPVHAVSASSSKCQSIATDKSGGSSTVSVQPIAFSIPSPAPPAPHTTGSPRAAAVDGSWDQV